MADYVKPDDVLAPKRRWQLFHVLFDGGYRNHPRAEPNSTVSLAIGRWDGRPALAMRWNGTDDEPLGNPQSRGLATWFIVPDQYVDPILDASGVSDSKLEFARDFLDLRRVYFLTRCPTAGCSNFGELVLLGYRFGRTPAADEEARPGRARVLLHLLRSGVASNGRRKDAAQELHGSGVGSLLRAGPGDPG